MKHVYPDTNVLIYLIENRQNYSHKIRSLMSSASADRPILVFSELTRMECRVQPLRTQDLGVLYAYDMLFANPRYLFTPMERNAFELATHLRAEHRLKTPDALHLAAAMSAGCDEFWTNDHRLQQAAQGRIAIISLGDS